MKRFLIASLCALALVSCSTTSRLGEGEYRLVRNRVVYAGDEPQKKVDLQPYIKQKPSGWSPLLYVYNWSSGRGTKWDRFVEKVGNAPVIFDSTQVEASRKSMLNHLEYVGNYNSTITHKTELKGKKAYVTYEVMQGPGYVIDTIDYYVPDVKMAGIMAADSANVTVSVGDILSQEALDKESERLASLFRNNGYFGFTKNYFFYYADTNKVSGHCDLSVRMEDYTRNEAPSAAKPHRQYHIGDVTITPQRGFKVRRKFLDELNTVKPGTLYDESVVNNTYSRMSSVPVFSSVNVQMHERDTSTVDCHISIMASKLQSVKFNLEASYNSSSMFGITPTIQYGHKNIFGGGEVFSLGLRGNFQFGGVGKSSSREFAVTAGLRFPKFVFLPARLFKRTVPRTDLNLSYNRQNRPEYTRNMFSLNYGYSWSGNGKMVYQIVPLRANVVSVFNMDEEFIQRIKDPYVLNSFKDHFDLGGSASIYYSTDPSTKPEHSWFYLRWQNQYAGNVLSIFNNAMKEKEGQHTIFGIPYSQFVRSELTLVQTLRFGEDEKLSLAGRFLAGVGVSYGNSRAMPFEQLFYAGGASSMRGWQSRSLGPGSAPLDSAFSINNQAGDMRLEANVEFRFPIVWKFEGGVFIDAGNVWNLSKDSVFQDERGVFHFNSFLKSTALDWGAGLRLDFGVILVRLDMGMKTYDPVTMRWLGPSKWFRRDGFALNFGIGYPF